MSQKAACLLNEPWKSVLDEINALGNSTEIIKSADAKMFDVGDTGVRLRVTKPNESKVVTCYSVNGSKFESLATTTAGIRSELSRLLNDGAFEQSSSTRARREPDRLKPVAKRARAQDEDEAEANEADGEAGENDEVMVEAKEIEVPQLVKGQMVELNVHGQWEQHQVTRTTKGKGVSTISSFSAGGLDRCVDAVCPRARLGLPPSASAVAGFAQTHSERSGSCRARKWRRPSF